MYRALTLFVLTSTHMQLANEQLLALVCGLQQHEIRVPKVRGHLFEKKRPARFQGPIFVISGAYPAPNPTPCPPFIRPLSGPYPSLLLVNSLSQPLLADSGLTTQS